MNQLIDFWREIVRYLADDTSSNHATIIIAIAAVLNLFSSILLWRANRKSAKITTLIFQNQFKPIIGVEQDVFIERNKFQGGQFDDIVTVIANHGQLEAIIVYVDFQIQYEMDDSAWHQAVSPNQIFTLAPNKSRRLSFPTVGNFQALIDSRKFDHYRIDIRYRDMAKQYYCYSEYRFYDLVRNKFSMYWSKNIKYGHLKTRYYSTAERFPKLFQFIESKRRTYGSEEKRIIKPQQSQESDQKQEEPTPPKNPTE
jgi:hypothetical protein